MKKEGDLGTNGKNRKRMREREVLGGRNLGWTETELFLGLKFMDPKSHSKPRDVGTSKGSNSIWILLYIYFFHSIDLFLCIYVVEEMYYCLLCNYSLEQKQSNFFSPKYSRNIHMQLNTTKISRTEREYQTCHSLSFPSICLSFLWIFLTSVPFAVGGIKIPGCTGGHCDSLQALNRSPLIYVSFHNALMHSNVTHQQQIMETLKYSYLIEKNVNGIKPLLRVMGFAVP